MKTVGGKKLWNRVLRPKAATRRPMSPSTLTSSESERTSEEQPVLELNKDNFQSIIMHSNKDVVVEFYTPEV